MLISATTYHYVAYPKRKSSSLFPLDILLTQVCTATTTYIVIDLLLWPCVLHQPASRSSIRSPFIHLNFLFHQPTHQPPVSLLLQHIIQGIGIPSHIAHHMGICIQYNYVVRVPYETDMCICLNVVGLNLIGGGGRSIESIRNVPNNIIPYMPTMYHWH